MFVVPNFPVVRDPNRGYQPIPATGAEVPENSYWLRRLAVGDVTAGNPGKTSKKTEGADA